MIKVLAFLLIVFLAGCIDRIDDTKILLSEEELQYISQHPTVTWAVEDNRPPYIYVENKSIKGISYEFLELISKKTGLSFKPIRTYTFFESIDAVRVKKVDIMTSLRPTPERAEFMSFTPPMTYHGGVFLYRVNSFPRSPLTTGIRKGEAVKTYLERRFPDMKIVEAEDDEESMALLQKGLLDGSIMDEASADFLSKRATVEVRKARINFDYPYSYGYRQEDHLLGSILTKAINSIKPEDKRIIVERWLKED